MPAICYEYDLDGNQVWQLETGGDTTRYVFDDANQLEEVTRGGVALGEYEYDAQGQRLTKTVGDDTIRYHYDGIDLLYTQKTQDIMILLQEDLCLKIVIVGMVKHFGINIFIAMETDQFFRY